MKHTYIYLTLFIAATFSACTSGFEELNTNPNSPVQVQPNLLLRQVIYDLGDEMAYEGFVAGNLLSQHFTAIDFNLFDRHNLSQPQLGGNPWPTIYRNLRDNEILLALSRNNEAFAVYEAPALILKSYMAALATDIYGDVPYTEALLGTDGVVTPRYDTQESIYLNANGIIDNLHQAIDLLDNNNYTTSLQGDIIYDGDLDKWKKLAASLFIKSSIRSSAATEVSERVNTLFQGGHYITTQDENAVLDFLDSQPNNFRMANLRDGDFNLFVMSETAQELLQELDDPRIQTYYRPSGNDDSYTGLLNGPDASSTSISVSDYSLTGTIFRENPGGLFGNFITSWEMKFLLAEAALKGYIDGDAQLLYEEGVRQAFAYWNTEMPVDYLTSGNAAYNIDTAIEQIITQKWIANSINGYEAWIEYRRTGFPALKTISASLNNNLIPVRMPYPADEEALNQMNYNIANNGDGNSVDRKVWWDVN